MYIYILNMLNFYASFIRHFRNIYIYVYICIYIYIYVYVYIWMCIQHTHTSIHSDQLSNSLEPLQRILQ